MPGAFLLFVGHCRSYERSSPRSRGTAAVVGERNTHASTHCLRMPTTRRIQNHPAEPGANPHASWPPGSASVKSREDCSIDSSSRIHLPNSSHSRRRARVEARLIMRSLFLLALLLALLAVGVELVSRREYPVPAKVSHLLELPPSIRPTYPIKFPTPMDTGLGRRHLGRLHGHRLPRRGLPGRRVSALVWFCRRSSTRPSLVSTHPQCPHAQLRQVRRLCRGSEGGRRRAAQGPGQSEPRACHPGRDLGRVRRQVRVLIECRGQ